MIGQKVGAYRLKRELGRGAFGVVYEADEEFDGRAFARVAVKIIRPRDARHRASLVGELATLANFRHPNIVGYRAFGELPAADAGELTPVYIATELAGGGTLADQYRKALLGPRALLELAREVADGLAFIAGRGWTHRDIKPDNLLCFDEGASEGEREEVNWKISDLGLARPTSAGEALRDPSGTLLYMAPETWRGLVAPSNDVWALGLCLREAATGTRLWDSAAKGALPTLISDDTSSVDVDVLPPLLRDIVRGCLERDPAQRWSAAQVAERARLELARLPVQIPTTLVVAQDGTGDFTQIRDALEAAPEGARLTILPGVYEESLAIERDVQLVGFDPQGGEARELVVIAGGAANVSKIGGGHVSLENLTLRGVAKQQGKQFHTVAITGARVRLANCRISNDSLAGVLVGAGAQAFLTACRVEDTATEGIIAQDGARVILEGGRVSKCGRSGVATRAGARLEMRRVRVSGCQENGVQLGADTVAYLLGCQFTGNGRGGVRVESKTLARIENCDARGNGYGAWEIPIGAEVTRIGSRPL